MDGSVVKTCFKLILLFESVKKYGKQAQNMFLKAKKKKKHVFKSFYEFNEP